MEVLLIFAWRLLEVAPETMVLGKLEVENPTVEKVPFEKLKGMKSMVEEGLLGMLSIEKLVVEKVLL